MTGGRVKARRYHHQVRTEFLGDRHDDGAEGRQVLDVAHGRCEAAGEGDVDVEPGAGVGADLLGAAGAGEKVAVIVTVQGNVEDVGVGVEDLLGAVAVVHVKIHDEDTLDVEPMACQLGRDGDRVEKTETPVEKTASKWIYIQSRYVLYSIQFNSIQFIEMTLFIFYSEKFERRANPWRSRILKLVVRFTTITVFAEINAHPEIRAHQKQWFFKGGVHKTDGFWWVILQRGGVHKTDGLWWVILQRGGGSTQNRWLLMAFEMFLIAFKKIKRPGRLFRQIR